MIRVIRCDLLQTHHQFLASALTDILLMPRFVLLYRHTYTYMSSTTSNYDKAATTVAWHATLLACEIK